MIIGSLVQSGVPCGSYSILCRCGARIKYHNSIGILESSIRSNSLWAVVDEWWWSLDVCNSILSIQHRTVVGELAHSRPISIPIPYICRHRRLHEGLEWPIW